MPGSSKPRLCGRKLSPKLYGQTFSFQPIAADTQYTYTRWTSNRESDHENPNRKDAEEEQEQKDNHSGDHIGIF